MLSPEQFSAICEIISTSNASSKTACKKVGVSHPTFWKYLNEESKDDRLTQYARAKQAQADFLAEEIIEIADEECTNQVEVGRNRNRFEARKWCAAKLKPKQYGDHIDVTSAGEKLETKVVYYPARKGEGEDVAT